MNRILHGLEYTAPLSDRRVFHYTCNAPSEDILEKYDIQCIGKSLGCEDDRGVLLIPFEVFEQEGVPIPEDRHALTIQTENLLTKLK